MYSCLTYIGVNGWLNTNLLVLLVTFLVIAIVYLVSRSLPSADTKAKLTGITKMELTQAMLSAFIIIILVGVSSATCSFSQAAENSLVQTPLVTPYQTAVPCPATNAITANVPQADPLTYAEYYTAFQSLSVGPTLATQIYTSAFNYAIAAAGWRGLGSILGTVLQQAGFFGFQTDTNPDINVYLTIGSNIEAPYAMLSDVLFAVFIPITILGISTSFMEYIVLVIVKEIGFTVLLPLAIIMRSLAFAGPGLRPAANSILALTIAMYIVFPMTISFNHYATNWIYTQCPALGPGTSGCNPSSAYLCQTYLYQDFSGGVASSIIQQPLYTIQIPYTGVGLPIPNPISIFVLFANGVVNLGSGVVGSLLGLSLGAPLYEVQYAVNATAEFFFSTVFMFAIDLSITFGLAMGLAKSLNSGIEGAASFWTNI